MRTCTKCGTTKDESEFQKRSGRKSGYFSACRECNRKVAAAWKAANPERTRELSRKSAAAFYAKYPERVRATSLENYRKNPKAAIERINKRAILRRKVDLGARLLHGLRSRINHAVRGTGKAQSTVELIGCSVARLRAHLERLFLPGMTWDNYGRWGWYIDHKKPCAAFNMADAEEQKKCFHYSNLQPLWAHDNHVKHAKWP